LGTRGIVLLAGAVFGLLGALLVTWGNPGNMGYCAACFLRDVAGALSIHNTATLQYLRPEIMGFVLGAFLIALPSGEFRARGGSMPIIRFTLGALMMIGALVFLGCPLRGILRLGGGDFNAITGLAGFACGVGIGTYFLRNGFNLGRSAILSNPVGGYLMPVLAAILMVFVVIKPAFISFSAKGPGAVHAAVWVSLAAGLIGGVLAQRARLCLSGGVRDFILVKDTTLLSAYGMILLVSFVANMALGQVHWGFVGQPLAHNMHVWNFLGLFLCGLAAVLAGGCPLRQLILAGEGSLDGVMTVFGMLAGAGIAHRFLLASTPAGATPAGQIATVVGIGIACVIGFVFREKISLAKGV